MVNAIFITTLPRMKCGVQDLKLNATAAALKVELALFLSLRFPVHSQAPSLVCYLLLDFPNVGPTTVSLKITGLAPGKHGFHLVSCLSIIDLRRFFRFTRPLD